MNKKGDLTGLIYLIATIGALAIFLVIAGYIGSTVATELRDKINSTTPEINQAFNSTINISENTLSAVWYIVFAGLLIGLFITAWHMPTNPIFVPIFIILLVVSIMLGIALSNAYEAVADVTDFATISLTQRGVEFMMSKLPWIAFVVGLLVLIVTFAKSGGGTGYQTPPM